jgi:hypothetical protein
MVMVWSQHCCRHFFQVKEREIQEGAICEEDVALQHCAGI